MIRSVVEANQLLGAEGGRSVSAPRIIAELHFIYSGRQVLHNRAYLASTEALGWKIFQERDTGSRPAE